MVHGVIGMIRENIAPMEGRKNGGRVREGGFLRLALVLIGNVFQASIVHDDVPNNNVDKFGNIIQ